MTTMFTASRPPIEPPSMLRASGTIVWRNLVHIKRMPEASMAARSAGGWT